MPNDGGPAFPFNAPSGSVNDWYGMTLRDFFAAAALKGMMLNLRNEDSFQYGDERFTGAQVCAMAAYRFADAMLAERQKGTKDV